MDKGKKNRYVAFFDMLGFKEAIKKNLNEAWGALEDLRVSMEETLNLFVKTPNGNILLPNSERVSAVNFPDSVIIFTLEDKPTGPWFAGIILRSTLQFQPNYIAKRLRDCSKVRMTIGQKIFRSNTITLLNS